MAATTTYVANPVQVQAARIDRIAVTFNPTHPFIAYVGDTGYALTAAEVARLEPAVGDYIVWQEDGYRYINPKAVFERKYRPLGE